MKNLNPIYLTESDYFYADDARGAAGGIVGGIAGNSLARTLLKNVTDIKKFILSTSNAEECIKGLEGYADGITPIAKIASICINKCRKYPENYKQRCLKILNNYQAFGITAGTLGGAGLGAAVGVNAFNTPW